MTKIAHVIALVNALIGFGALMGWLDLDAEQLGALMGIVALAGAAVGSFFDKNVPWVGPSE